MTLDVGFHKEISASVYHADPCPDPSLSSSIAKVLAWQTPRHAWQQHPRLNQNFAPKECDKFDLGTVAHEVILGRGSGFQVLEYDNYLTKSAKEAREAARAAGKTPILLEQWKRVDAMAERVNERLAQIGVNLSANDNECVLVWREGDAWCRAMLDSLENRNQTIIWDVKTTEVQLSDHNIARQIAGLSYDLSAAFYIRGLTTLFPDLRGRVRFRWIFIEASPPHEVRVIEASGMTEALGEKKVQFALDRWQHCMATGEWPGYGADIKTLDYPTWAEAQWLERELTEAMS